jgi:hypothetical protein
MGRNIWHFMAIECRYLIKKIGAFGGVFTPSLLTILGVIMFLRFSSVVGYAGLWYTRLILAAAKAISLKNADLMLMLAFMLQKNREWRDHPIRVIRPVVRKADVENIDKEMQELLALARIEAELFIVPTDTPLHALRQRMQPSALLLRGFAPPDDETDVETRQDLVADLERTLELPGDIIFVYNAGEVSIEA